MKKIIIITIVMLFSLISCEKVIDLKINNADSKIVVEAFTSNIEGRSYVKLTRTSDIYTNNTFESVSDASVIITDNKGGEFLFTEDIEDEGVYKLPGYAVESNTTYQLKIISDEEEIIATSKSSVKPNFELAVGGPKSSLPEDIQDNFSFFPDDFRLVFYLFSDRIQTGDNYRIISYVNGKKNSNIDIYNDVLSSGEPFGGVVLNNDSDSLNLLDSTDIVHLELIIMDDNNYNYFFSLVNNTSTGPFAATPSNPVSNLSDNALGYFGAYLMDTTSITVF